MSQYSGVYITLYKLLWVKLAKLSLKDVSNLKLVYKLQPSSPAARQPWAVLGCSGGLIATPTPYRTSTAPDYNMYKLHGT